MSGVQKIKKMIALYGPVGFVTHTCLSLTSLGICYSLVKYGDIDYNKWLHTLGVDQKKIEEQSMARGAGDFAIAYIIHKATMPIRVPITLAVVPIVARVVRSKKKF